MHIFWIIMIAINVIATSNLLSKLILTPTESHATTFVISTACTMTVIACAAIYIYNQRRKGCSGHEENEKEKP